MSSSPRYGLTTLTGVVIASMIGFGAFTTSGFSLASLGTPARVLWAWLAGGVVALCGAISYGQLARRLPLSGGEYLYLSRQLGPWAGFQAGWVSLTAGFSGAIAGSAIVFEAYLAPLLGQVQLPAGSLAVSVILVFGIGHGLLARPAALAQNAVVIIKLLVLAVFLLTAGAKWSSHPWSWSGLPDNPGNGSISRQILDFARSVMWISLSYAGFNAGIYVAAETRDPERTVPRSLWLGTILVTVLYLLLNLVFVTALPATEIVGRKEVAAIAAEAIGGASLRTLMSLVVCLGTLSSVAGMLMTGPRVFSRMADDGLFPGWFRSGPSAVQRTVGLQAGIAVALVLFLRDYLSLLDYLSSVLALSSAVTVGTLLLPSKVCSEAGGQRFPALMYVISAGLYVVATVTIAVLMALDDPRDLLGALVTLVTGTVLWAFFEGGRRRSGG
jgi:APA family basic amino acid/polyamine antiporter